MKKLFLYLKNNNMMECHKLGAFILVFFALSSCEEFVLADAGSKVDDTPPSSNFSVAIDNNDYLTYMFANLSTSATDYVWDFGEESSGDKNKSIEKDGAHTYAAEGDYTITLTVSDKLGKTSKFSDKITIVKPVVPMAILPTIISPGFDQGNTDATKDPWRNSNLGGILQVSSSSSFDGGGAAKFPTSNDRVIYQELTVTQNTDYILTYKYSQDGAAPSTISVSILAGEVNVKTDVATKTIASNDGTDVSGKSNFTDVTLNFNSGANDKIAIYGTNSGGGATSYLDTFAIAIKTTP